MPWQDAACVNVQAEPSGWVWDECDALAMCTFAGDVLTRCMPSSGRIVAAQFSVLMTFPCTLIIYKLLPITAAGGMGTMMAPYACVFFVTGCLISW